MGGSRWPDPAVLYTTKFAPADMPDESLMILVFLNEKKVLTVAHSHVQTADC